MGALRRQVSRERPNYVSLAPPPNLRMVCNYPCGWGPSLKVMFPNGPRWVRSGAPGPSWPPPNHSLLVKATRRAMCPWGFPNCEFKAMSWIASCLPTMPGGQCTGNDPNLSAQKTQISSIRLMLAKETTLAKTSGFVISPIDGE